MKFFCTCGVLLLELSAEKTNVERNNSASDDSLQRFAVEVGTRGLPRHPGEASHDYQTAKNHVPKALGHNFNGCADRRDKDAVDRKCMQDDGRTYETVESWGEVATVPRKSHIMTPQQGQAHFGNQRNVFFFYESGRVHHDTNASSSSRSNG